MSGATVAALSAFAAVAGVIWTYSSFIVPRVIRWKEKNERKAETELAMREVLLGREEGEGNPITGEPGKPKLPGIAERLNAVAESQNEQTAKLHEIHLELKAATEKRFTDLEHEVKTMRHQINELTKIIAVKAESEKDLFPAILNNIGGTNEST